ncbi:helix-turn-helix domain-containing protein [Bacteriovorax sp. DB6_IX]|uniref:helix-turn-helix domain-containing protein n=1 Tax=Bacteriovorax sp. DB6_IX TaxID=1353530 RepID=UPI00038A3803|nr:helix-turn-helix domain-containing protein [Bacteriovorax sp. DB6_IX]EQC51825.1 DNA-binding helix-turn-helix protein [Bacteriovorax sp. DB6_IX]
MNDNLKNYYEVLEVQPNSSTQDIQQAYTRAKNAYTGDSLALYSLLSQDEANKILELIEEAYNILSDPVKRKQYNIARGIEHNPSISHSPDPSEKDNEFKQNKNASGEMNKLVAKKRYGLEYQEDANFEVEIEQCTEFTGEFLKKIREYKNVDVNRLADMTKISKTYIRYIEEEDVTKMPAVVYVRGFVYQYAKCLKLNPELVANSYVYRLKKLKGEV